MQFDPIRFEAKSESDPNLYESDRIKTIRIWSNAQLYLLIHTNKSEHYKT